MQLISTNPITVEPTPTTLTHNAIAVPINNNLIYEQLDIIDNGPFIPACEANRKKKKKNKRKNKKKKSTSNDAVSHQGHLNKQVNNTHADNIFSTFKSFPTLFSSVFPYSRSSVATRHSVTRSISNLSVGRTRRKGYVDPYMCMCITGIPLHLVFRNLDSNHRCSFLRSRMCDVLFCIHRLIPLRRHPLRVARKQMLYLAMYDVFKTFINSSR
ncbi:MAG: hypothetical protein Q7V20_11115 [Aquabacterium sp.]|uniref:hypothetical protein n=1 Tax=Aquabacterium sp. TaxID=1872578 RepID=UPI00271E2CA2|nr:hypothetical protein [Aquabacterium sp.]MDO9003993.1 hypothetical protein [Aquabacterium sp.]